MRRRRRRGARSNPIRVLIVDDSSVERAVIARSARAAGHEVCGEASDVAAGAMLLRTCAADIVVLDGRIADEIADALASLQRAVDVDRRDAGPLPIVVVTSFEEGELARRSIASGAAGVVLRPILPSEFGKALERHARTAPAQRE